MDPDERRFPELFHVVAEPGSAGARRRVVERQLISQVRFRNLAYAEVQADFVARGGRLTPALWDGARLFEGEAAVLEALDRIAASAGSLAADDGEPLAPRSPEAAKQ